MPINANQAFGGKIISHFFEKSLPKTPGKILDKIRTTTLGSSRNNRYDSVIVNIPVNQVVQNYIQSLRLPKHAENLFTILNFKLQINRGLEYIFTP
jgi:hypothetical protein